jgi:hypothetical protein
MKAEDAVALFGVWVALGLGLVGIFLTVWQTAIAPSRDRKARYHERRADGLLKLVHLIESRGLAVQDQIYNATRPEWSPEFAPRPREVHEPPRTSHAEAAALVAAFATPPTKVLYESWKRVSDQWDAKLDLIAYAFQENGGEPPEGEFNDIKNDESAARLAVQSVLQRELAAPTKPKRNGSWAR